FFHHNDGGLPFFLIFSHKYLGWLVLLFNNITIHKLVNFPPGDFSWLIICRLPCCWRGMEGNAICYRWRVELSSQ
ncbi:hypothetical protein J4X71_25220, partial [Escherichia coli]